MLCLTLLFDLIQDEYGDTALHAASSEGHVEVMTILMQRGANVNSLNKVCIYLSFHQPYVS